MKHHKIYDNACILLEALKLENGIENDFNHPFLAYTELMFDILLLHYLNILQKTRRNAYVEKSMPLQFQYDTIRNERFPLLLVSCLLIGHLMSPCC